MTGPDQSEQFENRSAIKKWLPLLAELWIFAVLATFFLIRILGSGTVQKLLHNAGQ
jgi:hypothetical protein